MTIKVIEICYDMAAIAGCQPGNPADPRALRFRDAAARLIDQELLLAGLGAGASLELGPGEVCARFAVSDFDAAEAAIWRAVEGTPYACIREILRYWEADAAA